MTNLPTLRDVAQREIAYWELVMIVDGEQLLVTGKGSGRLDPTTDQQELWPNLSMPGRLVATSVNKNNVEFWFDKVRLLIWPKP